MSPKDKLKLLGAALYICEGTKGRIDSKGHKNFSVEFTNKDPRVIKVFLKFLRSVIKANEERIKAQLFIYPDHDKNKLIKYWSDVTNIPDRRFTKVIELVNKNPKYKPNPLGTLKIRYSHMQHFLVVQSIINEIFGLD